MSPNYGQVWDVRMVRGDNTRVRSFVDAQSGRVLASDEIGIREPAVMRSSWARPAATTAAPPWACRMRAARTTLSTWRPAWRR